MPNNKNNTNDFSCKDSAFDYDEHAEEYKGSLCDFANNLWDKILQESTYKYKDITDFIGVPEVYTDPTTNENKIQQNADVFGLELKKILQEYNNICR